MILVLGEIEQVAIHIQDAPDYGVLEVTRADPIHAITPQHHIIGEVDHRMLAG